MKSTTGSDMDVHFDKEAKPGVSNLHTIYSQLNNVGIEDFESKYKGAGYGT
jgi:tryptophanyl-tRNA synthetase